MFAFVLRAVLFLSVITWYTISLWSMIDGYFNEKFRLFLKGEKEELKNRPNKFITTSLSKLSNYDSGHYDCKTIDYIKHIFTVDTL